MMTQAPWTVLSFSFLLGACVGSFLNVVVHRLPRNQSLVSPGSHCPECGSAVRALDNIPLVSWLALFGVCRDCGAPISARYFLVELVTAFMTMAVVARYGPGAHGAAMLTLAWALLAASFIDIEHHIIPDEITIGGVVIGLAVSFVTPVGFSGAVAGLALGGGVFFALAIAYPGGMGGGDIKLMAAIGAFIGWKLALLTIIVGSLLGAVAGLAGILFFGRKRKDHIPFGPFLAAGAVVSILAGREIVAAYFAYLG